MYASIGGTDISSYIQESTYNVNEYEDYEQWIDGNRHKRREVMRTYVKGSFDLVFVKASDLTSFLTLMNNNKANGLLTITLYVQNANQNKTCQMFVDFTGKDDRKISTDYFYKKYNMSLLER